MKNKNINLAIFASGSGSNAEKFFEYFKDHKSAKISIVLSNKKTAYVLERAKNHHIPYVVCNHQDFYNSDRVINVLEEYKIDLIILAGFLWMIPGNILKNFPDRIINIHPALLPKYGGKGMYGNHVHRAVIDAREEVSGITIHYVNDKYDEGKIIYQARCKVEPNDTPESLAKKIQKLEHGNYPKVVEKILTDL